MNIDGILRWLIHVEPDDDFIKAIKDSEITSHRVVGRGMLTVDVDEIKKSKRFKKDAELAAEIVKISNS